MKPRSTYHKWTKEDYAYIAKSYESQSVSEIAEHLNMQQSQIISAIHTMRKAGIPIPSKDRRGVCKNILEELKNELVKN